MALTDKLTDIADAIRNKTETTEPMTLDEMPSKIESIETEPILQDKSIEITENGTTNIVADEGYDGLNNVDVTVNVESTGSGTVSTEKIIDFSSLSKTNVSVKQDGTTATYGGWYLYNYIALDDYEEIKYSNVHCFYSSDNGLYLYGIIFCDANKNFISGIGLNEADNSIHSNTIASSQGGNGYLIDGTATIPSNAAYMRTTYTNVGDVIFIPNISLIKGETSIGGETPEKGTIINKCDETSGFPVEITLVGVTEVPDYHYYGVNISYTTCFFSLLEKINLPNSVTKIGSNALSRLRALKTVNLSDTIQTIGDRAFYDTPYVIIEKLPEQLKKINYQTFYYCYALNIKTLPDSVTSISDGGLGYCKALTQISMNNVTTMSGSNSSNGSFYQCTGLKAVWIGSSITNSGLPRYSFSGCTSLQKIFIDLPRATVEAFTNYQYAFMNDTSKTGIIVCNDDEGFMTKEEFDAFDWSTYTE